MGSKGTCKVKVVVENSSFIFISYVKTDSFYDFRLALVPVVLNLTVKDFLEQFDNRGKYQSFVHRVVSGDLQISLFYCI